MKKTFFIADVHLDSEYPDRAQLIFYFLNMVRNAGGDLYILGDFFDFWANNRTVLQSNRAVLERMKEITVHGCRVCMMTGNRDLLLSQKALAPFGIEFLGEEVKMVIDGKIFFLTHGYSLCTMDTKFQRYKNIIWPVYKFLDKILPGPIENYLARKFILKSKQVINAQDQSRFQFSSAAIQSQLSSGIDIVICGHAHKAINEAFGEKHFYALPSWDQGAGGYLLCHNGTCTFMEFTKGS